MTVRQMLTKIAESALEEVPGATTLNTVLVELQQQRHERLGREFLRQVSVLLAHKAGSQVGTLVLDKQHKEWAADAVERGHQAILQAIDPAARVCLAALVAEYMHAARAPDRIYRRAANLFADVTGDDLPALTDTVDVALGVSATKGADGVIWVETHESDAPTVRIWAMATPTSKVERRFPERPGYVSAVQTLIRHGFARVAPTGGIGGVDSGNPVALFDPDAKEGLSVLASCLAVLPPAAP